MALKAVSLGLYVGFTGILTFGNSDALRAIAAELPADRIRRNGFAVPCAGALSRQAQRAGYVVETAKRLATVRGVAFEEIERQTTENFFRLFQRVPRA